MRTRSSVVHSLAVVLALPAVFAPLIPLPALAEGGGETPVLALVGVHVIPMDEDRVLENQTVVVEDGNIRRVGAASEVAVPEGARVIEGAGRFLMPGLGDLHVHVRRADDLINYVAWGVTTVSHMGGSEERGRMLLESRREIARGGRIGPNIYTTERTLDGDPPRGGNHLPIGTPEAARAKVAQIKADGFDFVKIYNNVSLEVFRAIIEEAGRQKLSVFGHIPRNFDALIALRGGEDAVAHTEELFFTYFGGPRDEKTLDRAWRPDRGKIPALVEVLVENNVAVMPDLCFSFTNLLMWDGLGLVWSDEEMAFQHPATVFDWRAGNINRREAIENFIVREQIKYELLQELTRDFQKGGVLQVIGTDAALPGLFPGKSAHRELTELVKAGLTNFEALSIGTRNAGEFVRRYIDESARFGRILPGYRADLLLVEGNPLEDVRHAAHVSGVAVAGRWYDKVALEAERARLAAAYEELDQLNARVDEALGRDDAEAAVRRILAEEGSDPERLDAIRERIDSAGYAAAQADDVARCREIFALGTRLFPESAAAWYSLGRITFYTEGPDQAIVYYRKALSIDPEFAAAREQLESLEDR